MSINITRHAQIRSKERLGLNKGSLERTFEIAKEKGLHQSEMNGKLRKYVDFLSKTHKGRNSHVIYGEHIYVICEGHLITILRVPKRLHKATRAQIKKKNS